MRCDLCGCESPFASRFCQNCSTSLTTACRACGRSTTAGARFCSWCGASLREDRLPREASGELKQATVLFADIVGSTELIAALDAEAAMERLRPVVAAMAQEVRRFGGTVLRTLGDGIKSAFGAPRAQDGHAILACQAALAMKDAVNALAAAPKIRVGIHSGEVVAGTLDTGSAFEQEAQGLTVHLANRIEQLAEPGSICISGACRNLIVAYCETVSLGPHTLRGISHLVDVYRLTGLRSSIASDRFRGTDLVPLRGRTEEIAVLREGRWQSRIVDVRNPPGAGSCSCQWARSTGTLYTYVFGAALTILDCQRPIPRH